MTRTVLIVDDHPMVRAAVATLLQGSDFAVIANAASARSALAAIAEHRPDMVILDIAMPGGSGLDVLRGLRGDGDSLPVIILTAGMDDYPLAEALGLDVEGIVLKSSDPAYLLTCLEAVRDGGRWIDPDLRERADALAASGLASPLSPRERQLVGLVVKGLRNREIAARLGITEGTVKVYLHAIFARLGVTSRTELAAYAADKGLAD